jgi:hypothetical protein
VNTFSAITLNQEPVKTSLIIIALHIAGLEINAQPYIDVVNCRYTASPDLISKSNKTILNYASLSFNLPKRFQNTDVLVISPFAEQWVAEVKEQQPRQSYYGLALPVSYIKNFRGSNKSVVVTAIVRMNDEQIDKDGKLQIGGAAQLHIKRWPDLTWKFGLYVNGDLFGLFVVPLIGIDWKINKKSNLFGLLPGNLTYERKFSRWFYSGLAFRSFTNSYARNADYWRIDENQLGVFADCYFTKNIVLNAETGSSILRKIRTGTERNAKEDWNVKDNVYFKLSLAYRMRFR